MIKAAITIGSSSVPVQERVPRIPITKNHSHIVKKLRVRIPVIILAITPVVIRTVGRSHMKMKHTIAIQQIVATPD